jgi:hypothetical protein
LKTKNPQIQISEFVELVAFPLLESKNPVFDIIIEEDININNYCAALINKICILKNTKYSGFIDYQTNLVADSLSWIENLEELISTNEKFLESNCAKIKIHSFFNLLEKKIIKIESSSVKKTLYKIQEKHINANSEDRIFSFYELLKRFENLKSDSEKIILLTQEKHDYKRANKININKNLEKYDILCIQEIEQIKELNRLKIEEELSILKHQKSNVAFKKLKININVNQIVDLFYQLNTRISENGKPCIEGSLIDLKTAIVTIFCDKDLNDLSPQTVETILKPSRDDKRPKDYKRIDLDKLL